MNCWMVGTAGPAMRRQIWTPTKWIIENKLKLMMGKEILCEKKV